MSVHVTSARRRQGFTLIEVMVSLGVMTIGALAILALQQQSIRSNAHARQLTTATQIAERWAERFKQDAQTWTAVGLDADALSEDDVLGRTNWLKQIIETPNQFQMIGDPGNNISNAFDYQGFDVPNPEGKDFYFCASFRPSWVYFGRAMRIDIRVWWARQNIERTGGASNITVQFEGCLDSNGALDPAGTQYSNYHVVYLPTVIRMAEAQ